VCFGVKVGPSLYLAFLLDGEGRNSDDPRVILEGTNSKLSSGWQWFRQIQYPWDEFYVAQTLPDLQRLFVSIFVLLFS
jgi:hypothetical protein